MSKYGFDEKELRKTIVTMIDKDGFHKKVVTYGTDGSSEVSSEFRGEVAYTADNKPVLFIMPGSGHRSALGYVYLTDTDYELSIGNVVTGEHQSEDNFFGEYAHCGLVNLALMLPENAIQALDPSGNSEKIYCHVYAVDGDISEGVYTVQDRLKLEINIDSGR